MHSVHTRVSQFPATSAATILSTAAFPSVASQMRAAFLKKSQSAVTNPDHCRSRYAVGEGVFDVKRDMDLIREILLQAEGLPAERKNAKIEIDGRDPNEIGQHLLLLQDARLAEVLDSSGVGSMHNVTLRRLTWEGHEFLDQIRNEEKYKEAKEEAIRLTGSAGFEVLKALLSETAKFAIKAALS